MDSSNRNHQHIIVHIKLFLSICLWMLSGCYQQEVPPRLAWNNSDKTVVPLGQHHVAGNSVRGRPIVYQEFGTGEEVVFILGAIHGPTL